MDGYEVCRRLREQGLTNARIIAMTGYGQEQDRQRAKAAGFDSHTVKPVEYAKLSMLLAV
jgi:CheY-like chemotaxis protein